MSEPARRHFDPEIEALKTIVQALNQLDASAHPRMLRWLIARYNTRPQILCKNCGEVAQ